jgi:RNA 2',3'-cyclic 3'-phosphodiesterase
VTARAFVACFATPTAAAALRRWPVGPGSLADAGDLHLTLHFLGNVPTALLPAVGGALRDLPQRSFALTLDGAEFWPAAGVVVAVPGTAPPSLVRLQAALGERLRGVLDDAAWRPQEAFRPHVTLTRRGPPPPASLRPGSPVEFDVADVTLALTAPEPGGRRYRAFHTERLAGGSENPRESA